MKSLGKRCCWELKHSAAPSPCYPLGEYKEGNHLSILLESHQVFRSTLSVEETKNISDALENQRGENLRVPQDTHCIFSFLFRTGGISLFLTGDKVGLCLQQFI